MDIFVKGIEDIERIPTLLVDDAVYNTSVFTAITVNVFHHKTLTIIGTYTLAAGTVEKVAPTSYGQIRFVVTSEQTAAAKKGKYFYQVQTLEADTDFPGNVRERAFTDWCFELKHSV